MACVENDFLATKHMYIQKPLIRQFEKNYLPNIPISKPDSLLLILPYMDVPCEKSAAITNVFTLNSDSEKLMQKYAFKLLVNH